MTSRTRPNVVYFDKFLADKPQVATFYPDIGVTVRATGYNPVGVRSPVDIIHPEIMLLKKISLMPTAGTLLMHLNRWEFYDQ